MLHYVGEPIWAGRTDEEICEAVRHEALLNVMLEDTPMRVLCPYDAVALDDAVLASAKRTHPEIVENGTTRSSRCYSEAIPPECEDPAEYSARGSFQLCDQSRNAEHIARGGPR